MKSATSGNALSEYGFVLALVAVAAIGALTLLGGNVGNLFRNMGPGLVEEGSFEAIALGNGSPNSGNTGNTGSTNAQGTVTATIDLGNGRSITLTSYPTDLSSSIQTAGASGTTELILANLRQLIEQLQAAGEINAAQAKSLMDLANAGHTFGEAHKYLEDSYKACPDSTYLANDYNSVCHNGIPVDNANLFWANWGADGVEEGFGTFFVSAGLKEGGAYQNRLDAAYQDALEQGALDNPQVKKVVDVLKTQISVMGNTMGELGNERWDDGSQRPMTNFTQELSRLYKEQSHLNASNICTIGGDQDSGVSCSSGS